MIGIIGGSGLEDFIKADYIYEHNTSPYCFAKIKGVNIVFMSRHGLNHELMPHEVPYKNNALKLKQLGCKAIIDLSACGSLRGVIKPGDIVVPDSVVDWTNRLSSITNEHVSMGEVIDQDLREIILTETDCMGCNSLITIPGPRFSTKAESKMFRALDLDIINMTTCPFCFMIKELDIPYVVIAMVTDYDSWKPNHFVTIEEVKAVMKANAKKIMPVLEVILPIINKEF